MDVDGISLDLASARQKIIQQAENPLVEMSSLELIYPDGFHDNAMALFGEKRTNYPP